MSMFYLNTRHTLPMIGVRMQLASLETGITQPRYEQESVQARSEQGKTQPQIYINTYPSRHSYGYTNHTDFAREHGQEGIRDVQQATAMHTRRAWTLAEDAPKPGRMVLLELYKKDVMHRATRMRGLEAAHIPDPEIRFDVGEVVGDIRGGRTVPKWYTKGHADVRYRPGSIETYLRQKGEIHSWLSEGSYDIYA